MNNSIGVDRLDHFIESVYLKATNNGELKLISKLFLDECSFGYRSHSPNDRITSVDEDFHDPCSDKAIRTGYQDFG